MIKNHNHSRFPEKMQRCQDYIQALEEERCKIQVFQRELPLCLELVTQAIDTCKQQLSGTSSEHNLHGQSECSEPTCSDVPFFEEFIPLKRASSHSDSEEQDSKKRKNEISSINKDGTINGNDKNSKNKKPDWLRSAQLWNQTSDPPSNEDSPRKIAVVDVKRNGVSGGAFHPFNKEKSVSSDGTETASPTNRPHLPAPTSSTAKTGGGNKREEKEGQSHRKSRRCWSPELHKRFLQSLQQLGGSHVATPKQIRELMKVDGLTNDEVKSHLQKYRLHTRRPSPSIQHCNNNTQTPQFVVVGGIWVPPEYAAMAETTASGEASGVAASKRIYTPIAALPPPPKQRQQHKQSHSDDRISDSDGGVQSHSPATSSSTRTTTPAN